MNHIPVAIIADADTDHSMQLAAHLQKHDWQVLQVATLDELRRALDETDIDLAFVGLDIGNEPSWPLFEEDAFDAVAETIVMGETDDPLRVRDVMSKGATYFFCKPFDKRFLDELLQDLTAELVADEALPDPADLNAIDQFGSMRGSSRPMRRMYRVLRKVAATDASVLLIGESGTGKELAAETLHSLSERAEQPLVAMNCGAIPQELIESELFGHEKGAFTGAGKQHLGYFERAHQGTLFLDEITEMPLELQVKLLRVLEVGRFRRVGGEQDISSDARIIAATNRDPEQAIADGVLREDLYYRIASFPLHIPPLRRREGDVVGLAQFFLNEHNEQNDTAVSFDSSALTALREYSWPGNVRELKSAVERAYVLANQAIDAALLPSQTDAAPVANDDGQVTINVGASMEEVERELIYATLEQVDGDKKRAAQTLGISLKTLYNRLNEYESQGSSDS